MSTGPYILVSDDDGHWYVIPKAKHTHFEAWLMSEEANAGIVPEWAASLGCSPSNVTFPSYEVSHA